MHRRIWIREVVLAGGAILLLPACMNDKGALSVSLANISITAKEEALFADVCETIIPETDTPGAMALNIHQFVLKMMDDCYDKPEQQQITRGLRELNHFAKISALAVFTDLKPEKKVKVLREIKSANSAGPDLKFFLTQTRKWVIKGYDTSEYVLTRLVPYQLVPGFFHGCVRIDKTV